MTAKKTKPTSRPSNSTSAVSLAQVEKTLGLTVAQAQEMYERLTPRQLDVARLMAKGLKNVEIAEQLGLSIKTLDIHRGDVYYRLKVETPAAVARIVFVVDLAELANK